MGARNRVFTKKGGQLLAACSMAAILAGCGGGGSSSSSNNTTNNTTSGISLSGVVAVGTPVASANVTVFCSSGNSLTATTNNYGEYAVTLNGQTPPCVAEATAGTVNGVANSMTYHSI